MLSSEDIKNQARILGFSDCGIAKVRCLEEQREHLDSWLSASYNAEMTYMERNKDKRLNPSLLVDEAKSVVVVLLNYYPQKDFLVEGQPIISKYAYGKDYHTVVKDKLFHLFNFIKQSRPDVSGRCFVDSAPVLEHSWAQDAGLGWIGKNSLLINKEFGSFTFIGELIINIELDYDSPFKKSFCGTCTKCMDTCPTNAIVSEKVIDASRCISYNTIEKKGDIPEDLKNLFGDRIFGCDICQDVCPWNRAPIFNNVKEFSPVESILNMTYGEWEDLTDEQFALIAKDSPLQRAGLEKMKYNCEIKGSLGNEEN